MRKLVAEIGSCNGDLKYAYDAVDAFAEAGVWAIKGQLYHAASLVTRDAKPYGKGLQEPATQYEAFTDTFSYDQWGLVKARCDEKGVVFFGSVFDLEALAVAHEQEWTFIKLASADITYRQLLERVAGTAFQVFLSTGASTRSEIMRAVELFDINNITVLACTLSYPCQLEDAHVDRMDTLRIMYPSVGYSDHTRGIAAADYAFRMGADMVEKHVTLTPGMGGDHDFAITPEQVSTLVGGDVYGGSAADCLVAGESELFVRDCETAARRLARRSPYMTGDVKAGGIVDGSNTRMLRPAAGVDPWVLPAIAVVDLWEGQIVTDGLITQV